MVHNSLGTTFMSGKPTSTHGLVTLVLAVICVLASGDLAAARHALLVGVGDHESPLVPTLAGPENDVNALADTLTERFGFAAENTIRLIDSAATETAILGALADLDKKAAPGDTILFYYSGHGTSASDKSFGSQLNLPDGSGALVAWDLDPRHITNSIAMSPNPEDGLIVGRSEIRPRLESLDRDRNVLVLFDACFSGNATRDFAPWAPANKRLLTTRPSGSTDADVKQPAAELESPGRGHAGESDAEDFRSRSGIRFRSSAGCSDGCDFDYRNTVFIGAAAENQEAVDISASDIEQGRANTIDGLPHGGFTDALLRVLDRLPPESQITPGSLFAQLILQFAESCSQCGHEPVTLPGLTAADAAIMERTILTRNTREFAPIQFASSGSDTFETLPGEVTTPDADQDAESLTIHLAANTDLDETRYRDLPARIIDDRNAADFVVRSVGDLIEIRDPAGMLLQAIDSNEPERLNRILLTQRWVRERRHDIALELQGGLFAGFRHPLLGSQLRIGDTVRFTLNNVSESQWAVLVADGEGYLNMLHPIDETEATALLPPGETIYWPPEDAPALRVVPPAGTDTLLFYAWPPGATSLATRALSLAQKGAMDSNDRELRQFVQQLKRHSAIVQGATLSLKSSP